MAKNDKAIWLIDFCVRNSKKVTMFWIMIILVTIVTLGSILFSKRPVIDNSVGIWFMKDDPELQIYENFNQKFGEKEWTVLLLETDSVFTSRFLNDLDRITNLIEKVKHIGKVISLTNIRNSKIGVDSLLEYKKLYPVEKTGSLLNNRQLIEFKEKVGNDPLYENSLLRKKDSTRVAILFQNDNYIHALEPYRIEMIDSIKSIVKQFPSVKGSSLAGTSVVNAELNRSSRHDVFVFYILVALFITLSGYFLLRNTKDLIILLTVVTFSALPPMALLILLDIQFNMVTVMVPPVLISLSVCDVTHVINAFHFERKFAESQQAIGIAIKKIWMPCLWTSIITIVGFLSLSMSSVFPIWQLGIFGAFGIFLAWFITMTLVPNMLVKFWPKKIASEKEISDGSKKVGLYSQKLLPIIENLKWVWMGAAFILLFALIGISKLKVDTDYTKFFGHKKDITRSYEDIRKAGFGQNPVSIVLNYPKGKTLYSDGYFSKMLKFEEELKKDTTIIKLLSVSDLIYRIDIAFNGKSDGLFRINKYNDKQLAQLFMLGEMSNNDDIANFTNDEKNTLQVIAMTHYMSSHELSLFKKKVFQAGKVLPPEIKFDVTGTTVLWANMDKQISGTQMESIFIIALIFLVLLPFIFKSLKFGVVGFIINSLPLALTFGIMGLLNIKINMATALIGAISIGSSMDSTIFFINRFRLGLKQGMSWNEAVDYALITVGDGIIMTSLILAGGFFCLATSNFLPTAHLGIFVTVSVIISLFLDIIINPIVFKLLKPMNGLIPDLSHDVRF
jgi:predicted RND superfamily exporter protein